MRREATSSADLHLFQELSTLGRQLAHALLLRQSCIGVKPMFPATTSRPGQAFGGARSSADTAVHSTSTSSYRRGLASDASAGLELHARVRRALVLGAHARHHLFENMSTCWLRFAKSARE
jgi:hypothetical protein